jgi:hypothetical protein
MLLRLGEPRRNVPAGVEEAPYVDIIVPLDVEDEPRKPRELAVP